MRTIMDKNYFIQLTIHLYQTTDSFIDEEPLKFLLRKKANEILESLSRHHLSDHPTVSVEEAEGLTQEIQSLQSLLKVAEAREESDRLAFFLLGEEYERVREELQGVTPASQIKEENLPKEVPSSREPRTEEPRIENNFSENQPLVTNHNLSFRQEKIVDLLQHQPDLEVNEISKHFSGVTSRTIRRDLDALLEKKLIQRRKVGKQSFYQIKPVDKT